MKTLLSIFSLAMIIQSCSTNAEKISHNSVSKNDNYVVILDLSDRIIARPDQVDIDTSAIRAAFEKFESSVQKNLVVKSRDKFNLRIIPQKLSSLPESTFENALSIDMGKFNAAEKLKALNKFKQTFGNQIKLLYQQAYLGSKTSNYAGVDMWQYFNEQVNSDIDSNYYNKVIITDGYFDFEDRNHGITSNSQSTITGPLLKKLSSEDWKQYVTDTVFGLLPVKLVSNATWVICGIQPKAGSKDLLEAKKLACLWKKWLKDSGATEVADPIINTSSGKIKNLIMKTL